MQWWSMAVRLSGCDLGAISMVWRDLGWPWLGWAAGAWHRTMCGAEGGAWVGAKMRLVRV